MRRGPGPLTRRQVILGFVPHMSGRAEPGQSSGRVLVDHSLPVLALKEDDIARPAREAVGHALDRQPVMGRDPKARANRRVSGHVGSDECIHVSCPFHSTRVQGVMHCRETGLSSPCRIRRRSAR